MLQTWIAQRLEYVMLQGRTRPLVLNCLLSNPGDVDDSDSEETERLFVVKGVGLPEVDPATMFNETVGNLFASRMGLQPPEPALIVLTEEFISAVVRQLETDGLRLVAGTATGSTYLRGLAPVPTEFAPSAEELEHIVLLYTFDMIVQNPDRRLDNTNCAYLKGTLVPFDFDMCFSFIRALGRAEPLEIPAYMAANHCFRRILNHRKSMISWKPGLYALRQLADVELGKIISVVPLEWQTFASRICSHISSIRDNTERFEFELQKSVS